MKFTYSQESVVSILNTFSMDEDEDGLVVDSDTGELVKDARGNPIKAENVVAFVDLAQNGLSVDDEGFVTDEDGCRVTNHNSDKEALVPYEYTRESSDDVSMGAMLREGFGTMMEFLKETEN